jgi:hypothetical protein
VAALTMAAACSAPVDQRTGQSVDAILTGTTFEGNDGNLVVDTSGKTDWCNHVNSANGICDSLVTGFVEGLDRPTGNTDDSFGQGTKEDDPNVKIVTGSIPPNKNDLTRFYIGSEFVGGSNFLYLAWERLVNIGAANLDFEINKLTSNLGSPGPHTINRSAGDLLITYDFSGSGTPTLALLKWVTTGAASQCFSSNALPCWGNRVNLSAAGFAEGQVNTVTVTDPIQPNAPRSQTVGLFGEASINLTSAGVFPAGTCVAFGSAFVKSRSSSSFPAEVKDFIAPQPVNISNCGTIKIHKVTENGDATFGYTTTGGLSPSTFNLSNGGTRTYDSVVAGSYSVTESTIPASWTFKSLVCTATGSGSSVTTNGATASMTVAPSGLIDCTYTNHTNVSPTITTTLSASTVTIGIPVHDSATLTGATADAGGTVTYTAYTDSSCTQNAQSAGTKTVTNGVVPNSDPVTFPTAGTFYWQASYSGDANNNAATSACTSEVLVVTEPTIVSSQSLIANDCATFTGLTSDAGGTITFELFDPTQPTCSGSPDFTQTVNVNGNGSYCTSNTTFTASVEGTWRWLISYSGDSHNEPLTVNCGVENFTITND